MKNNKDNTYFMQQALKAANDAQKAGEVPVGAVIVKDGKILSKGFNRCITDNDPTAHAEIVALRKAAKKTGNYRLNGCSIYVTIEPCTMCIGALINARVDKVYFGALDKKAGACKSVFKIANSKKLNHNIETEGAKNSLLKDECAKIIQDFFKGKRKKVL